VKAYNAPNRRSQLGFGLYCKTCGANAVYFNIDERTRMHSIRCNDCGSEEIEVVRDSKTVEVETVGKGAFYDPEDPYAEDN
jgi:DNA-directed RNA polymerase subunit RPC12/RpoP